MADRIYFSARKRAFDLKFIYTILKNGFPYILLCQMLRSLPSGLLLVRHTFGPPHPRSVRHSMPYSCNYPPNHV